MLKNIKTALVSTFYGETLSPDEQVYASANGKKSIKMGLYSAKDQQRIHFEFLDKSFGKSRHNFLVSVNSFGHFADFLADIRAAADKANREAPPVRHTSFLSKVTSFFGSGFLNPPLLGKYQCDSNSKTQIVSIYHLRKADDSSQVRFSFSGSELAAFYHDMDVLPALEQYLRVKVQQLNLL